MRLLTVVLISMMAIGGCGPAPQTAAGFVVDVQSTSLTEITSFTLRTEEGEELVFRVGVLDLDGGGFPGTHLREHMITNQPVAVAFDLVGDDRVASRLVDAPWLQPRPLAVVLGAGAVFLSLPTSAFAHGLLGRVESPLPLVVYLTGAALAVGLSFAFVLLRNVEAPPPAVGPPRHVPRALALLLRAVGLIGWAWIVAQTLIGGSSAAEVALLFLWAYGWVAIAALSAFVGPVWHFIDPFSTLFDLGASVRRALKVEAWELAPWLGRWPAAVGFLVVVWLELGLKAGSASLGVVLIGYTALTLAMMAQFGRDTWRANGEVFTVWFSLLGRLAPFGPVDTAGEVRRRPFVSGLLARRWTLPEVAIVSLGVGSILFDGLSQTEWWFGLFALPGLGMATLQLLLFLGLVLICVLGIARLVGLDATGAGLVPIAVGYLVAHYLTFLLGEGQRLIVAISDPFQLGWDLFGTAFYEPGTDWIPPTLMWTVQLAAVVGGHIVGAWAGHIVAAREVRPGTDVRLRQLPLAVLMVALTATTLWSLGQAIVQEPTEATVVRVVGASIHATVPGPGA